MEIDLAQCPNAKRYLSHFAPGGEGAEGKGGVMAGRATKELNDVRCLRIHIPATGASIYTPRT